MSKTVKAREHYGANSLDLTIPSDLVREHQITPGDIFEIKHNDAGGDLTLKFRRVYENG